ncbi:Tetratricopeptide repeat-containing protein [Flavobacterium sp. 9AF]|uniref:tetratricopeptide repeat protein n=1 Tax=Flavobacterium sp. 9AF TaxID=2653142 RepID=UPI0012F23572|nr:tetratricopeptide repeat protein [Flavobacterium sp. 9AF]VXB34622.1 Tetratricopeptide repeat-containing protein [Flavobacterium sp. 9AF]
MDKETLLTKYFEGTLTEEESILFHSLLENDTEFKNDFNFQKNVKAAIALEERKELKNKLQHLEATRNKSKNTKLPKMHWVSIAASFILFAIIGFWFYNSENQTGKLYKKYYQTFPNVEAPVVRGFDTADIKSNAFYAYDSKNYEKALDLFSKIYEKDKDDYALFYKGLSLMELTRFKEAITAFEMYQEKPNSAFNSYIKWYLSLCYLQINEIEKSKVLLNKLVTFENPFQNQANHLLDDLE